MAKRCCLPATEALEDEALARKKRRLSSPSIGPNGDTPKNQPGDYMDMADLIKETMKQASISFPSIEWVFSDDENEETKQEDQYYQQTYTTTSSANATPFRTQKPWKPPSFCATGSSCDDMTLLSGAVENFEQRKGGLVRSLGFLSGLSKASQRHSNTSAAYGL